MKKNDMMPIIGFVTAIALLIFGMTSQSGYGIFIDPKSMAITVGGSIGGLMISYPMNEFKRIGKTIAQIFKEGEISKIETINLFIDLSRKARREGLLSLEDSIADIQSDFIKKSLNMVVDGIEPESIKEIMTLEINSMEKRHYEASAVFKTLAAFGPAFGMLGTLIGLIQMLVSLSDVSNLTSGMGKALITTFYGSMLANLIALPISTKLDYKTDQEVSAMEMIIEGVLAIQSGVNPRIIEDKLIAYLSPAEKAEFKKNSGAADEEVAVDG